MQLAQRAKYEELFNNIFTEAGLVPLERQPDDPFYGQFLTPALGTLAVAGTYVDEPDIVIRLFAEPLRNYLTLEIATRFNGVSVARSKELPIIKEHFALGAGAQPIISYIVSHYAQAVENRNAVLAARAATAAEASAAQLLSQRLQDEYGLDFSIYQGRGTVLDGSVNVFVSLVPGPPISLRLDGLSGEEIAQTLSFISHLRDTPAGPGEGGPIGGGGGEEESE